MIEALEWRLQYITYQTEITKTVVADHVSDGPIYMKYSVGQLLNVKTFKRLK